MTGRDSLRLLAVGHGSAGLRFDFYLATKHHAVHYLHATLGPPPRVIAEQMGWSLAAVLDLLAVYGHGDVGALKEIHRAFAERAAAAVISDATLTRKAVPNPSHSATP
ncbi:MAG TPA: hypothetical protein VH231_14330 [Solirubrobacteraceae bacterium]|jgi:hypothetical protein|nr:hypothetical protein [Solirubrobacteraceae bacterium]